ncbi:Crp/Fnr family transcriptional regulator [Aureibaculum sp. 2210JD6-5]|uniref:Crp/Fnr family transcriptional regulator n=1 Tax=Aureibaculum sp. 2210JD6-5 TaxID=3103957 RepID=UPI002AAE8762|nr:Crp/Fnr family transcriptional regulator [Aureibaculum sp. 2210JD6-5]MDY7396384.1 Crp/Fnr family transcriptional regulator [Aureibaculum sp. 2210JD6-5]
MESTILTEIYKHPLISPEELKTICLAHKKITLSKGIDWLKENQISNSYLILGKGLMRSYVYNYEGDEITTNFFSNTEIVIEVASLFQRIPSQENIEAITDCDCWQIDFDVFQQLFHSIEGFREWGRSWMAQSLFELKLRSISTLTDDATTRYQKLTTEKPLVLQHAPLKQIASFLGITNSSLSRIRKEILSK